MYLKIRKTTTNLEMVWHLKSRKKFYKANTIIVESAPNLGKTCSVSHVM